VTGGDSSVVTAQSLRANYTLPYKQSDITHLLVGLLVGRELIFSGKMTTSAITCLLQVNTPIDRGSPITDIGASQNRCSKVQFPFQLQFMIEIFC
jgi:hypothetical protein